MIKTGFYLLAAVMLCLPCNADTIPREDLLRLISSSAVSTCSNPAELSCTGLTEQDCHAVFGEIISQCISPMPEAPDTAVAEKQLSLCTGRILSQHGISSGTRNCSHTKPVSHTEADMKAYMQAMRSASPGTEQSITLPIYPGSEILIHIPPESVITDRYSLPSATFHTGDSPDKVMHFYRVQLPAYHRISRLGTKVLVATEVQGGRYPDDYLRIPSVMAHETVLENGQRRTLISLHYQPRPQP